MDKVKEEIKTTTLFKKNFKSFLDRVLINKKYNSESYTKELLNLHDHSFETVLAEKGVLKGQGNFLIDPDKTISGTTEYFYYRFQIEKKVITLTD